MKCFDNFPHFLGCSTGCMKTYSSNTLSMHAYFSFLSDSVLSLLGEATSKVHSVSTFWQPQPVEHYSWREEINFVTPCARCTMRGTKCSVEK